MAITVGLDFGTHQTKVCIENSDNPLHKTYEFFEWKPGVYALPSVIQINQDRTLRYGSVDLSTCLVASPNNHLKSGAEPTLPPKPTPPKLINLSQPKLPPMPVHKFITDGGFTMSIPYKDLYGIHTNSKTAPYPSNPNLVATPKQRLIYQNWLVECAKINESHKTAINRQKILKAQYDKQLKDWEIECAKKNKQWKEIQKRNEETLTEYPHIYRYFKQATFASYAWKYAIKSSDLTIVYLAYIIFQLEEKYGKEFTIQMGVPASERTFTKLKRFASAYLIQAYRLVENVFENDFERFLATPYDELLSLIPKFEYSDTLKEEQYGIMILPEAYAALRSVTVNSRIPTGMSIMLDIGGGTTDISFFTINPKSGEPHIYHYDSISKGLNFFLEYDESQNSAPIEFSRKTLGDLRESVFRRCKREYETQIDSIIHNLTSYLHKDTIAKGIAKTSFTDAIANRPVIYSGGGSTDDRLRRPILAFTDVKHLNKQILNIPNVINEISITVPYSILATSFGLSIQRIDDNIEVSKKEDLFAELASNYDEYYARQKAHREHGMSDD